MSRIEISNERLANAVRTTDAVSAFSTAVDNGQSRLALDILGDIIPALIGQIESLEVAVLELNAKKDASTIQGKVAPKLSKEAKENLDTTSE